MRKEFLHYDADLCVACHSCEMACKVEHNFPVGVNRIQTLSDGPKIIDGRMVLRHKKVYCMHCSRPPCLKICPTGAIQKRPDGIVLIDQDLCTGCQECARVCPFDAIRFHPQTHRAEACDLCAGRLDEGLSPFCIQHCMSGALFFGTEAAFKERKREMAVARGDNK